MYSGSFSFEFINDKHLKFYQEMKIQFDVSWTILELIQYLSMNKICGFLYHGSNLAILTFQCMCN